MVPSLIGSRQPLEGGVPDCVSFACFTEVCVLWLVTTLIGVFFAIFTVVQRVRHACDQEDIESMELYDKSLGAVMDANKSNPSEREFVDGEDGKRESRDSADSSDDDIERESRGRKSRIASRPLSSRPLSSRPLSSRPLSSKGEGMATRRRAKPAKCNQEKALSAQDRAIVNSRVGCTSQPTRQRAPRRSCNRRGSQCANRSVS